MRRDTRSGVPWYVWVGTAAVTCAYVGGEWDVSWHRSIGADTFWSPPHLLIYACAGLAAVVSLWLVVAGTVGERGDLWRPAHDGETVMNGAPGLVLHRSVGGVRFFGLRGPLGVFVAGWGGVAMLTAAPFDRWWHAAYGLDNKMMSPPHVLLIAGLRAIALGMALLAMAAMNRADDAGDARGFARLRLAVLWLGGMAVASQMYFVQEFVLVWLLHRASAYVVMAAAVTGVLAAVHVGARSRWGATCAAGVYMAVAALEVWVLPLFPATPRLGPVLYPVVHMVPLGFPVVMVPAAAGVDWVLARWPGAAAWKLAIGVAAVFLVLLVAVEWPFASFLMSPASRNWVFGKDSFGYAAAADGPGRMHVFIAQGGGALAVGLAKALVAGFVSAWVGVLAGRWMRGVRR